LREWVDVRPPSVNSVALEMRSTARGGAGQGAARGSGGAISLTSVLALLSVWHCTLHNAPEGVTTSISPGPTGPSVGPNLLPPTTFSTKADAARLSRVSVVAAAVSAVLRMWKLTLSIGPPPRPSVRRPPSAVRPVLRCKRVLPERPCGR
jgi:hypothetical protein